MATVVRGLDARDPRWKSEGADARRLDPTRDRSAQWAHKELTTVPAAARNCRSAGHRPGP